MNDRWLYAMESQFPDKPRKETRVLDIGTGPEFFSILLAEAGYFPNAVDCTEEMLKEARKNAGEFEKNITFQRMNADSLELENETFDAGVNRNLTWNLQNPCECYKEWFRVLKPFLMWKRAEHIWQLPEKGLLKAWKAYMIVKKSHQPSHT